MTKAKEQNTEQQVEQQVVPVITEINEVHISVKGTRGLLQVDNVNTPYAARDNLLQLGRLLGGKNSSISEVTLSDSAGDLIAKIVPSDNFTSDSGGWVVTPAKSFTEIKVFEQSRCKTTKANREDDSGKKIENSDIDLGVDLQEQVLHAIWVLYPTLKSKSAGSTRVTKAVLTEKLTKAEEQRLAERQLLIDSKVDMSIVDSVYPDLQNSDSE